MAFSHASDRQVQPTERRLVTSTGLAELIDIARRKSMDFRPDGARIESSRTDPSKTDIDRGEIGGHIAEFLIQGVELSDTERRLVDEILSQLIRDIEFSIRRDLAASLSLRDDAPEELVRLLAADDIEIARPILLSSAILTDMDLLDLVNQMNEAHRQVIAERPGLSINVTDALVEYGEHSVIISLLTNQTARLSQEAMGYLVATSKQVEAFREPLLNRTDLPPKLAYRMFWWVSAALRRHLLERFEVPPAMIDGALARIVPPKNEETMLARAAHLFRGQNRSAGLGLHDLISYMHEGRAAMFIAAMAEILLISADTARRLVLDQGGEGLSLICRASGIPTQIFRRLLESLDENLGVPPRKSEEIARMVAAYEDITTEQAHRTVKYFDCEPMARAG
jgi:uncharacterized protein (DUF2336 family)